MMTIQSHKSFIEHLTRIEVSRYNLIEYITMPKVHTLYKRWGRTDCPSTAELVYKGVMSGAPHNDIGSGANYLCLPHQPRYNFTMAGYQSTRGSIAAVEFRESYKNFKPTKDLHGVNFPCAVCQAPRSVSLLLPADTKCPIG
ncbi:uncharacterized protein [Antedon mediterranea]|uniref:uncharacterized protein n=1 Tax=Antedon mediterranea TaxID=105859 RepID=UPI003AF51A17